MALEIVLGAAVGELFSAVTDAIKTIASFRSELKRLQSTLTRITPSLNEIIRLNKELNQSETGIHGLVVLVSYGKNLVLKCSTISILKRYKHSKLLIDLDNNLSRYFTTDLPLSIAIDLLKTRVTLNDWLSRNQIAQPNNIPAPVIPIDHLGYETPSYAAREERDIVSIGARDLDIEWSDNGQYWKWFSTTEASSSNDDNGVAELLKVWFLHVGGKFGTELLHHGTEYKVVIVVKLIDSARGWEAPVMLKLKIDGNTEEQEEWFGSIPKKQRNQWLEITVGTFTMSPSTVGLIEFSLEETTLTVKKNGLLIKGAAMKQICYEPEILVGRG